MTNAATEVLPGIEVSGDGAPMSTAIDLPEEKIVNRDTSLKTHPLASIKKSPSFTPNNNLTGFGIEIEYFDEKEEKTDWNLVGSVSPDYLLVPNREVIDIAGEIAESSGLGFEPSKLFWDGKRMMYMMRSEMVQTEVEVGDTIALGLMFENSYNGSTAFRARLFAERLVCSNGMCSKQFFQDYAFRHVHTGDNWQEDLRRALSMVETGEKDLQRFTRGMQRLQNWRVEGEGLAHIRQNLISGLPTTRFGQVVDEYLEKGDYTGYGFLNACTRVTWHRDKSITDYSHNRDCVDALVGYAFNHLN